MASLLNELLVDERGFLAEIAYTPKFISFFWASVTRILRAQVKQLEDICARLDSLSIVEASREGDQEYQDFLLRFQQPEEYDFSTESELIQVRQSRTGQLR